MNRLVRGLITVVAAGAGWACGTDLGKDADKTVSLSATPSVVFVANTDSQTVDIEALNADGQQLAADFQLTNVGAGITVRLDSTFQPIPGGTNPTRARYIVRAATPATFASASFTVSANGQSVTVPVSITPANLPATFSNVAPNPNDTITITAPAPLTFASGTTITFGTLPAQIVSISADSSSITFVPVPSSSGVATVTDLRLPYLSSSLTLNTTDQISVLGLTGTDDFTAAAPVIPLPGTGETVMFLDAGAFNSNATCLNDIGGPCRIYQFTVTGGDFDFSASWQGTTDLGFYIYDASDVAGGFIDGCDGLGAGGTGQPEACTFSLPPGTYYIANDTFSAFYAAPNNVDPTFTRLDLTGL
jgi:hypothetical protein